MGGVGVLSLVLLVVTPELSSGREAAFRIEGDLSRESFLYGRPEKSSKKQFTIVIENCRWQIESSNEAEDFYSLKSFSDGVIHNVSRVPENLRKTSDAENSNGNKYHVVAEKHDVPRDDYSGISYLWLAYCSNCYFDALDGDRLKPVWMLDDALLREEGFTVRGLFSRPDDFLPQEVVYLHDGLMRIRSRGERKAFRAPAPFDRGFTNAVFKVLSATNLGEVSIPLEFEFLRFGLNQGEGGPQLNLRSRIVGTVNRVTSRIVPQDFVQALEGPTFVQDLRFAKDAKPVAELRYRTTNAVPLPSNDARLIREHDLGVRNEAAADSARRRQPMKTAIFLVTLALIGAGTIWMLKRSK